ncbi:MAG: aspartate aminotransferase [Candidatus Muiribacterium halophilum]|uniref:Aminotransferase n=1 Tax=Muiribacterium halophilum TaxID=2053465 RepID=A0A2N5ZM82_MUIH1|nr:MAG: aspartate aminotransferase [Candidatus Muirbacterium halophilum]
MYNKNVLTVGESATILVADMARELREQGKDIISFAVGEPDFDTPKRIKMAARDALKHGFTKYTDLKVIKVLRETICEKLLKDNQLEYTANQIIVSNGAKHALFNSLYALVNPGDEVIVITPAWVSYFEQIKLLGGIPVVVESKNDFSIPHEDIKKSITKKTKAIILNSPCNPTGSVYTKEEITKLAYLILEHDNLFVISDEIYEKIIYKPNTHYSIAAVCPEIKERTVVINGFSKAYSMTGWRMGYSASNLEIAKLIAKIQSHMTSCPNSISQWSSLTALDLSEKEVQEMIDIFEIRKNIIRDYLKERPKLKYVEPKGAFYFFIDFSAYIGGKVKNSNELSMYLLKNHYIALTSGKAFFKENYLRISYATNEEKIKEGLKRLDKALEELS